MQPKLYHTEIFVPPAIRRDAVTQSFSRLVWTKHAQGALFSDRYGTVEAIHVPLRLHVSDWSIIELEVTGNLITKYVLRRPIDSDRSLIVVVRPRDDIGLVTTCWINLNTDNHKTLDRTKYENS